MLKLDKGSSGEAVDMLGQSLKATKLKNLNTMISNHQRKAKVDNAIEVVAKSDRETIIEGLKRRLDSSDSIIRETDSDSIASEADSLFCLNADDSLEYEEQLKYPIEIFIQPKNKNLALAESNSDVPWNWILKNLLETKQCSGTFLLNIFCWKICQFVIIFVYKPFIDLIFL